jgi:hypothetical protein
VDASYESIDRSHTCGVPRFVRSRITVHDG